MINRGFYQSGNLWFVLATSVGVWTSGAIALDVKPTKAQTPVTSGSISSPADSNSTLQQIGVYSVEGKSALINPNLGQVTSVSQFSDVRPTDWAFQALQSLVERYGCIVGYPDKTYRGNRALTRYEFAAGLNACLDKIQELIAAATSDFVRKEDLEVVKRLQEEFAAELAALRGRVEALEVRTATLEKQQFTTTTKLSGEVIVGIADTFGDRATRAGNDAFLGGITAANRSQFLRDFTNTIFTDRVRLAFDSSFNGRDRLRVRIQGRNTTAFSGNFTGTNGTRLGFDGSENNAAFVDKAFYRFPIGQNLRIQVDAFNAEIFDNVISTLSPFESAGQGSVSRFGRFNPIYRSNNPSGTNAGGIAGGGSAGVAFDLTLSPQLSVQGGYFADQDSNDPSVKNGLFNGNFTALGQIVFRPSRTFDIGFTYARSYFPGLSGTTLFNQGNPNVSGSTGTAFAANPFPGIATKVDALSAQLQWRIAPRITIGGWYGYSFVNTARSAFNADARVQNWAAFVGFPDLGGRGNLAGFVFGAQPRVTDTTFRPLFTTGPQAGQPNPNARRRIDEDVPYHLEAFYRYRLNDNISITPGVFVLFNPEGNSANATQYVGVVRTTFTF